MARYNAERCPICNGFGSPKYGGYCKNCKHKSDVDEKHVFEPFSGKYGCEREFVPVADKCGLIKDKFGIER